MTNSVLQTTYHRDWMLGASRLLLGGCRSNSA